MKNQSMPQWSDGNGCMHYGQVLSQKDGYDIIACEDCQFTHAIPIPDGAVLKEFYEKKYYQSTKPDYAKQHENDQAWWDMVYGERYARLQRILGRKGSVLDIGSGPGFFLSYGAKNGWDVTGIEPSEHASEYARKLGVRSITASFDLQTVEGLGSYDIIQINQAIEHIPNPRQVFELCRSILSPDGLICIIAANDFNTIQLAARKIHDLPDWWVIPPEHLNYFSLKTLSSLIACCGYEVVSETATFPIDMFLLMGDNYINNSLVGKHAHERRKKLEFALMNSGNEEIKEMLYQSFALLGLGREVEVIGRKTV